MKEGWKMVKLGDVCETSAGGTPSKTHKEYYENGNIPWLNSGEVCQKYILKVEHYITTEGLNNSSAKLFPLNSVVIAMYGATAGQVGILKIETSTNQAVCAILPNERIIPELLYYYFLFYKNILVKQAVGNAQPNISQQKIKSIEIPLLSLEEQHRIVSILDASFEKIDALKKNAEENLKNAKALFQQVLAQELKPKEGWVEKKLGEVSKEIFAGGDAPKQNMSKTITEQYPIPIYANAVEEDGLYGFTNNARVNEPAITIAARGSGTGYVLRRKVPFLPIVRLIVIIPNPSIEMDYMYYALKSINIRKAGAAIPQLTVPMLREYKISFPIDIKEQHRIVQTLDTLSEKCRRLEEVAQQTIRECDALKQSILRQAFSGEL